MPDLEFPSDAAPSLPVVRLTLPDGWEPLTVPGAVMAARALVDGHFASNVVVSLSRHSLGYTIDEAAAVLDEELASLDEAALLAPEDLGEFADRACVRIVAFNEPGIGALAQIHLLVAVVREVCVDLVGVVASCAGDRLNIEQPELVAILDSLVVG